MPVWGTDFVRALKAEGVTFCAYVPDRGLDPILQAMQADPEFQVVLVTREEEGVGVVSGAALAGRMGVLMMQTTGLGNSLNALTSLPIPQTIPLLMVITERGRLGEGILNQIPMGRALRPVLDAAGISHFTIDSAEKVVSTVAGAARMARFGLCPVALILEQQFSLKAG